MSDAQVTALPAGKKLGLLEVVIKGRIEASRTHGGIRYTRLLTPAASEFDRPQTLEVRGKERLGEKGDVVTVTCRLGGFSRKAYRATDKDSGEVISVTPVDHTLDQVA